MKREALRSQKVGAQTVPRARRLAKEVMERFSKHDATSKTTWKWRWHIHIWKYDATSIPFPRRLWRRVVFGKCIVLTFFNLKHVPFLWLALSRNSSVCWVIWSSSQSQRILPKGRGKTSIYSLKQPLYNWTYTNLCIATVSTSGNTRL